MLDPDVLGKIIRAYRALEATPGFRARPTQKQMIMNVATVLARPVPDNDADEPTPDQGRNGPMPFLCEAPTGTGKSLAYLTAAVPLGLATKQQVVISTGTVALQEQLVTRDIPRFLETTGFAAEVVLAKGRTRYFCPKAAEDAIQQSSQGDLLGDPIREAGAEEGVASMSDPDRTRLHQLAEQFASQDWDGDMDSLPVEVPATLRPLVTSTASACTGRHCAFVKSCPLMAARADVRSADIIVSNHDLLLVDLLQHSMGLNGSFIRDPAKTLFIIDEGHHLGDKARERAAIRVEVNTLVRLGQECARLGQQVAAQRLLEPNVLSGWVSGWSDLLRLYQEHVAPFIERVRALAPEPPPARRFPSQITTAHRFTFGIPPDDLRDQCDALSVITGKLFKSSRDVLKKMRRADAQTPHRVLAATARLSERLEQLFVLCRSYAEAPNEGDRISPEGVVARWISREQGAGGKITIHSAKASGARLLEKVLWNQSSRVLVTSATMSQAGNFHRVSSDLGLYHRPHIVRALPSPFDLESQAELVVPAMRFQPGDVDGHTAEIIQWLVSGPDMHTYLGTLVLFTSRAQMTRVYEGLPPDLQEEVTYQGQYSKAKVLSLHTGRIQAGLRSILFGLNSFSEGLDLPGELCRQVIIARVPFAVPDDPVEATLGETMKRVGLDPFRERAVPLALRQLVQACGRLIRTETDTGRIVILDRRLLDRPYGRNMLAALPPFARRLGEPFAPPGAPPTMLEAVANG